MGSMGRPTKLHMGKHKRVWLGDCVKQKADLPPEVEEGNIEYKLKIAPASEDRLTHLCTQLRWRLGEFGECWRYMKGSLCRVSDKGELVGIEKDVMDSSLGRLEEMCRKVGAEIADVRRFPLAGSHYQVAEVRIIPSCHPSGSAGDKGQPGKELRIAFLGDTNVGKSTLLGVFAYGDLDNGRGSVRLSMLRHRHEIISGRTSSVSVEPLVFMEHDSELVPVRSEEFESVDHLMLSLQRLYMEAPKVLQFFDLPGRPRFHRSTLGTLTSIGGPDLACLVVSCTDDESDRLVAIGEYLGVLSNLGIPTVLVVAKTDLMPSGQVEQLRARLAGELAVPVFPVSALSGAGVDDLLNYLVLQDSLEPPQLRSVDADRAAFVIESVKELGDVGLVFKGSVLRGSMCERQATWFLGPEPDQGCFRPVQVKSIHRLRIPVQCVGAGLMASVAVDLGPGGEGHTASSFKGMLLVGPAPDVGGLAPPAPLELCSHFLIRARCMRHWSLGGKAVKGLLVMNGVRWQASLEAVAGESARVTLADVRILVVPGMKYILVTHLGMLSGITEGGQ